MTSNYKGKGYSIFSTKWQHSMSGYYHISSNYLVIWGVIIHCYLIYDYHYYDKYFLFIRFYPPSISSYSRNFVEQKILGMDLWHISLHNCTRIVPKMPRWITCSLTDNSWEH